MKPKVLVNKLAGFYTGICATLLCIISTVVYVVNVSSISYKEPIFDPTICIILVITSISSAIFLFGGKLIHYAPVLLCLGSGISLLMYIKMIIWPISDTIYGIEPFPHMNTLIICFVLLFLSFIFSEISLYMKKLKDGPTN